MKPGHILSLESNMFSKKKHTNSVKYCYIILFLKSIVKPSNSLSDRNVVSQY